MSFKSKILILVILAVFTRFIGLDWGRGNFFHPDENNMATALSQLSGANLNPNFFAYGQFPLYLGYFSLKLFGIVNTFTNSIFILRFWSAIFSLSSLYFFYKIYPRLLFLLLLIFTPGLIQLAHFGTTESLLIFCFSVNLYLSQKILKKNYFLFYFFAALSTGIAMATKISGAIFIIPIFLAALMNRSLLFLPYLIITALLSLILSPYNFLAFSDFISSMRYETEVASGILPVFYTTQFNHTWPYIFQLTKIFPYTSGWPVFLFAFLALPFLKIKNKKYVYVLSISSLIYFAYFGQLFVKWTRFMSPLFFVFPLLASRFLDRFPKLTFIAIIPGIIFLANYFLLDTRLLASKYLTSSLPSGSIILSESGNVVNLPVPPNSFDIVNYDFYDNYPDNLSTQLSSADYIIIPSRRVFKNYSYQYYSHLFDGSLGFQEIEKFSPLSDFFLDPENAEETWSVFDRPTIRIYKKVRNLSLPEYEQNL